IPPHAMSTNHPPTMAKPTTALVVQTAVPHGRPASIPGGSPAPNVVELTGGDQTSRSEREITETRTHARLERPSPLVGGRRESISIETWGEIMLERLARWSYRNRWKMLAFWIVALIGIITLGNVAGGNYSSDFSLPGAESQKAFDLLQHRFQSRSGGTADIVFYAPQGANDPSVKQRVEGLLKKVATLTHVDAVSDPYATSATGPATISRDGKVGFAEVQFDIRAEDVPKPVVDRLENLGDATAGSGLEIEYGGQVIQNAQFQPPGGAEAVGIFAAIIILLLTFGSVLAMGLPIMTALFGIGIDRK